MKSLIAISLAAVTAVAAASAGSQTITGGSSGGSSGGVTFGNPTGTVSGTVVNGSASTAMRSDAAPALATGAAVANLGFTPPSVSGTPTTGNCVKWTSATQLGDVGAACGSGGSGSPGGSSGQLQYNNSGAFGGVSRVPLANLGLGSVFLAETLPSANMNSTSDQTITLTGPSGTLWTVDRAIVTNCSASSYVAAGAFYGSTGKTGGIALGSPSSTFMNVSGAGFARQFIPIQSNGTTSYTSVYSTAGASIYLSLSTAEGATCTCDVYIYGRTLS